MIAIIVSMGGGPARRIEWPDGTRPITIGSKSKNDLRLIDAGVAGKHARITFENRRYYVSDLGSAGGTRVNGAPIAGPTPLTETDRIQIGAFELELEYEHAYSFEPLVGVEPWQPADAIEAELVAAVANGDSTSRLVYADWLENRGDFERAEYLRVQQQIAEMTANDVWLSKRTKRLRVLSRGIDVRWRQRVAQTPIENCQLAFELVCPRRWDSLATTDRPDVRSCETCRQSVYYCTTIGDARARAQRGQCVAVDVSNRRSPDDLEGRMMMGRIA